MDAPLERSYWADPGRLLAGAYPGEYDPADTQRNIQRLIEAGIRSFINLMEAREENHDEAGRSPYVAVIERTAARFGVEVEWRRCEIHDMWVPDVAGMDEIQALIDDSIARGRAVYAHCWAGRGRTGTVVGAYLIRRGLATPENFVDVITGLRTPHSAPSPETGEQVEFVRRYALARGGSAS